MNDIALTYPGLPMYRQYSKVLCLLSWYPYEYGCVYVFGKMASLGLFIHTEDLSYTYDIISLYEYGL